MMDHQSLKNAGVRETYDGFSRALMTHLGFLLLSLILPCLLTFLDSDRGSFSLAQSSPSHQENPQKQEAGRLYRQGTQLLNQGESKAALETFIEVLQLVRNLNERQGEAATLNQIALAYYNLGLPEKAMKSYEQALQIFQEMNDRSGEGVTLNNLGAVYRNLGQYQKALFSYQKALEISQKIQDRKGEGTTLNNLAAVYDNLGQFTKALEFYQQALTIFKEVKNQRGEGMTLNNMGLIYQNQGELKKALTAYENSLQILQTVEDRLGVGRTLTSMGLAYHDLGDDQRALKALEQALMIRREISDRPGEGVTLNYLGTVYRQQKRYIKALGFYRQALQILEEVKDRASLGSVYSNMGLTFLQMNQLEQGSEALLEAVKIWESLRPGLTDANKVSIFERQVETYQLLQQSLIKQNQIERALEISERGRSRAFVELLASRLGGISSSQVSAIQSPSIAKIKAIARLERATLVVYSLVGEAVYIWVISPQGDINFRQIDIKILDDSLIEIAEKTRSFAATGINRGLPSVTFNTFPDLENQTKKILEDTRLQLENSKNRSPQRSNKRLLQSYQLLIEPIVNLLPKDANSRVIFIPQGSLFLIPFNALQDQNGNYLIEKHTIIISPSIQVLDLTHQHRERLKEQPGSEMLVVGNPIMPSISFHPDEPPKPLISLPGAEKEALEIARIFKTQALIGKEATEGEILRRISQSKMIHLATHGLLNEFQYQGLKIPGAIALSADSSRDGLLTSSEILALKLNAELVVLSACNTGRGAITGDGVMGLSRAFISAGVPSIVVSLWSVPDEPTAYLMIQFYQKMQQNYDKAAALRQALLATMKKYPEPNNWAAFILIGDSD